MAAAVRSCVDLEQFDDDTLVRGVLSGDRELFAVIVRRYSRRLHRVAISVVRDFADAEDIVQDTFVSALQHLHQYSGRAKFIGWLTRIAVNHSLACLASRSRGVCLDDEERSFSHQLADSKPTPEQRAVAAQRSEILNQAIAALSERHRSVVALRDLHELDTRTAATHLGISEENVKVRLHRARRCLRVILTARRMGHAADAGDADAAGSTSKLGAIAKC